MFENKDDKFFWDAGDMGCGELIIKLRNRFKLLDPGDHFELIALDPGAKEDLPAWSHMTGNRLVIKEHPRYVFKKK